MDQKHSPVFLRGRRVILRPFGRDDLPVLARWINDPEVREYIGPFLPKTEIAEEEWLHKQTDNASEVILAIETVEEGRLIGSMGLHHINWKDRVATTGALIGEKDCWGKGYGTDAKMLILSYAFLELNLRKICSTVLRYTDRSLRYSLRCGYHAEGRQQEQMFKRGRYWDVVHLAIFREEWEPLWTTYNETGTLR